MADTVPSSAQMKQALAGKPPRQKKKANVLMGASAPVANTRPPRQKKKANVMMGVFPQVANTDQTVVHSPFLQVMGVLQAVGVITGPVDDTPQTTGQSSGNVRGPRIPDAVAMTMLNSHMPADAPKFEGCESFKGGNVKKSTVNNKKKIAVPLNEHGVAKYKLNPRYWDLTKRLRKAIQDVGQDVEVSARNHPYLNFSRVMISEENRDALEADLFPNSADLKKRKKRFQQFLCSHGINSYKPSRSSLIILTFIPERWNRVGYRLTVGGDSKGGKPQIKFEA